MIEKDGIVTVAALRQSPSPFSNAQLSGHWARMAFAAGDMGAFLYDVDGGMAILDPTLTDLTGLPEGGSWFAVQKFFDRIHSDDLPDVQAEIALAIKTGRAYSSEFRFTRPDGMEIWLAARGDVIDSDDGARLIGGVKFDVTALKTAEQRANDLAAEMGHRVRNVINVAQVMARMTGRTANSMEDFLDSFNARLSALADVSSYAVHGEDDGISAAVVIERTLAPFQTDDRITISAGDIALKEALAETLALILHELGTNAIKYGALSQPTGTVAVGFSVDLPNDELAFRWREKMVGGTLQPPDTSGFGRTVLKRFAASIAGGKPEIDWKPDGLSYTCRWSISRLLDDEN